MRDAILAFLIVLVLSLQFGCAHPVSRGPIDPWVTGCETDTECGCILDCLQPIE